MEAQLAIDTSLKSENLVVDLYLISLSFSTGFFKSHQSSKDLPNYIIYYNYIIINYNNRNYRIKLLTS